MGEEKRRRGEVERGSEREVLKDGMSLTKRAPGGVKAYDSRERCTQSIRRLGTDAQCCQ